MNQEQTEKNIALVLSGGGIRAMVFHLGVLRYLAERKKIESISKISTVSGGSLIVGFIFNENKMNWPSSEQYSNKVYPILRKKLTTRSMQRGILFQLLKPWNYRYILSRANLLALELEQGWGVSYRLSELPSQPEWSINGTTAENGKRFRFKHDTLGDYSIGYASSSDFPLSNALAVSAAFPGGIGPLTINTKYMEWKKRPTWDSPVGSEQVIKPDYARIRLYDGGVYDNLGLEPIFDSGKSYPKNAGDVIIVSDAGAPLKKGFSQFSLNPWRLKRIADIMSEQTRALRVRTFINYLQQNTNSGAYIYIDTPISAGSKCESQEFASNFPTTLRCLNEDEFDKLANHGYEVAMKADMHLQS